MNFYPRSPCGERLSDHRRNQDRDHFYPRSPCGERPDGLFFLDRRKRFLSTLSLRRATLSSSFLDIDYYYFYPRSPCGERPITDTFFGEPMTFLSTLSLRRATSAPVYFRALFPISIHALLAESDELLDGNKPYFQISIHALLAESDPSNRVGNTTEREFLSTLSLRRATLPSGMYSVTLIISIHALLAESDFPVVPAEITTLVFLSTLSLRRATMPSMGAILISKGFLSTLSLRRATYYFTRLLCLLKFLSTLSLRRATLKTPWVMLSIEVFLSTLSLRRATAETAKTSNADTNFYPRSPCGERQFKTPVPA